MSFADMIFHHALTRPEKPSIILADRVATYGMMAQGILSVEDRLRSMKLEPGSLVAVAIESPIRHLILAAALYRLGHPSLSARHTSEIPSLGLPIGLILEGERAGLIPGLPQILVEDDWFTGPARRFDATPSRGFANGDAICRISFSSGTTGRQKAYASSVDIRQRIIVQQYQFIGQGHWDRMLCLPPVTNGWGFTVSVHALYAGKTVCFATSADDALSMIAAYNADCLVGATQHIRDLVEEQKRNPVPIPSLRLVYTGGSLPSRALLTAARASLCPNIVVQYSSTEVGSVAFATADRLMGTEGAVGFVAPWAEVQTVDAEGRVLPPHSDGILRIRTAMHFQSYPESVARTEQSFRDGWFYPGDLGRVTEDGMLILSGRMSEIINAGGAKIAPEMVEEILRRHPAVADAAAFGGLGTSGVEEIWVAIVPRTPFTDEDIIAFCAEKGMLVARAFAVAAIPRTTLGKIERERLKRELTPPSEN